MDNKMPKSIFLKTLITGRQQSSQSIWGNPGSFSVLGKEVIRRLINFLVSSLITVSGCTLSVNYARTKFKSGVVGKTEGA